MAWGFFMNMEVIALEIAKEHLQNMHDDIIIEEYPAFDEEKLLDNIKNGFVIITQLNTFIETLFNTILNSCMDYQGETLLKMNIEEKMEIIFFHYQKDKSKIKSLHLWEIYKTIMKLRNEMIHYKKTFIGDGSWIPDFEIAKNPVKKIFTKKYMQKAYKQIIELGDKIAEELGLKTYHEIGAFACDAKDGLVNYIYDDKYIFLDDDRFSE